MTHKPHAGSSDLDGKFERVLLIHQRLLNQQPVNTAQLSQQFDVGTRTIQRDIKFLKDFYSTHHPSFKLEPYDRTHETYKLTKVDAGFTKNQLLVLVKILLSSRSLIRDEVQPTIDQLLNLTNWDASREIKTLINSELALYHGPRHQKPLLKLIWEMSEHITQQETITIVYRRNDDVRVDEVILPEALVHDTYYFYLVAYSQKAAAIRYYRLDRIVGELKTATILHPDQQHQFRAGDEHPQLYAMHDGHQRTIQIEFRGPVDVVLDRFPLSKEVPTKTPSIHGNSNTAHDIHTFNIIGYDTGITMWLMSQGDHVKVLKPYEYQQEFAATVRRTLENYDTKKTDNFFRTS